MPEGPEVKIITEGLTHLLSGKTLTELSINSKSRYHKKAPDGITDFTTTLPVRITRVHSHGKFIWWEFANGWVAWQTLGLAGGWFLKEKKNSGIHLNTSECVKLYYDDARHFGTLKFLEPSVATRETTKKLKTLGPDILAQPRIPVAEYIARFRKYPNHIIGSLLMEQKVMSGVGNYLRSEILYAARVNPHNKVGSLTDEQLTRLHSKTYELAEASYRAGGASIQHYSDIHSTKGQFEYQMQVYGRKKTPGGLEIRAEKLGKETQTTYWCPELQN
jgi:DNA-formamidopyrimidine glycosylase